MLAVTPAASSKAKILPLNATARSGGWRSGVGASLPWNSLLFLLSVHLLKIQLPILENSERLIFPVIHHPDTQRLVRYLSPKPSVLTCMHPTSSQELYPNPFPRRPQYHPTQCHQRFKGIVFVNDNEIILSSSNKNVADRSLNLCDVELFPHI